MPHRLGFAVKVLGDGGLPSHDTRRWQSGPHLSVSLQRLAAIFDYLDAHDVRMYRMASGLVPYGSHPEMDRFHGQVEECGAALAAIGARARTADLRLSFHPGQYAVLNSEDEEVRAAAALDVELQASVLDAMGLGPEAVVVLHVGGVGEDKAAAIDRFLAGFEQLGEAARARLVIENDDGRFGLADVLALSERSGLRVVWDVLHHRCYDPDRIPIAEALSLALATWPAEQVPKIHYSSPRTAVEERKTKKGRRVERRLVLPPLRAHADMIDPIGFEDFLRGPAAGRDFDLMLEAKAKDLALQRLREQLIERGFGWRDGRIEPETDSFR
ncbi:MAG: UV DNA damage repair endonuclease UvsE [Solirubrobacterales bacterium]